EAILSSVDPDAPDPANLFRVHWYNDVTRKARVDLPGYLEIPSALTGVRARIVVALGRRFSLIGAHKVLAAYACLVPRLVTGAFDPARSRAIWPSTGNYCRGGVAISRILGCRGVAVLPAGMSAERFEWLRRWVAEPEDIVRTPGSESNVKEIYDECANLARDPANVILNQFCEFPNYLAHYFCTGRALSHVFSKLSEGAPGLKLAAFVAGTGSAGTLAAGDYLKEQHGTRIVAVEPLECPTMLYNGYGEHNIQGIGDKHLPLIHNVMNTDVIAAVPDGSCDLLNLMFNSAVGREYLTERRGIEPALAEGLAGLGLSGIANVLACIKTARRLNLSDDDVLITVATDGAELYVSERDKVLAEHYPEGFDMVSAAEVYGQHLLGVNDDHLLELNQRDRRRVFNLGYYTWVEQQGVSLEDFDARADQQFWRGLRDVVPVWDELIEEFNRHTGVNAPA
ncbi:MAG TPA: pyridoxal-phosphate dependent enzyme, partial [Gammaproteobacteria bacterium]